MLAEIILAAVSVSSAALPYDEPYDAPHALHAASTVQDGGATTNRAADRLIGGILSYVRWPDLRPLASRKICVVGVPKLSSNLRPLLPGNVAMHISYRDARDVIQTDGCDALFLGSIPVADRQKLIGWVRGRPVLTLTDTDPSCSGGAMFCLVERQHGPTFLVNLDAIARGPLRVDPRVLRIGKDGLP
ncbi:YfiR family protein [Sphingopyxis yananensis]|uniref:YfiR family protein n=1 Tax=Sphingopyxis yananensis TaxID=2886687 RepID=UPI001D0F89E8|nr:YfiR family protein [Sphingopyxis yananensis]MCC2601730.1 YfiR family protein [Sphingopyxis yananensis]